MPGNSRTTQEVLVPTQCLGEKVITIGNKEAEETIIESLGCGCQGK